MSTSPFDIARQVNEKTDLEFSMSDYAPWMINKILSLNNQTLFFANEMNRLYSLDKDLQHAFYLNGIPKGKRFSKWLKKEVLNQDVETLSNYFCINKSIAEKYLALLSDDDLFTIKTKMLRGGR